MDETAAGANGLRGLPAPNPNGVVLGTIVVVEADGILKPPLPNRDEAGVAADDVNAKLFGIVKVLIVEDAGNELVLVAIAGVGVIVEELNKFEEVAVFVVIDGAEVLGIDVNPGD